MGKYFWIQSGEDGTTIEQMTGAAVEERAEESDYTFLSHIPENDGGYWTGVEDRSVVIIKGDIVLPKPVEQITKYVVP